MTLPSTIPSFQTSNLFTSISKLDEIDAHCTNNTLQTQSNKSNRSNATRSQMDLHTQFTEVRILMQLYLLPLLGTECQTQSVNWDDSTEKRLMKVLNGLMQCRSRMLLEEDAPNEDMEPTLCTLGDKLETEYTTHKHQWQKVLNRRHATIRLHSGLSSKKNGGTYQTIDQSFWQQVTNSVQQERLLEKLNINKGDDSKHPPNILYDDSKLYTLVLQEFIRSGTTGANVTVEAATQRLQKVMEKKKRKVLPGVRNKTSKDKRMRYTVIEKLVNYAYPIPRKVQAGISEDVFFKSMFGGVHSASL